MAYGRRRAAARLRDGRYAPHPGWRHLVAPEHRVLVDQAEALAVVDGLVDAQDWRSDKRCAWLAILRRLACSMDWDTGLITAVTLARLGDAGARAPRTVSRVIAWARDTGLLVVVEHGASAAFLGTDHGRTPTYVLVAPPAATPPPGPNDLLPVAPDTATDVENPEFSQVTLTDARSGDLPVTYVDQQPLTNNRLEPVDPDHERWPSWQIPQTAAERITATRCLFQLLGLDIRGVSGQAGSVRIPLWRAVRQFRSWWDAGLSPRGLNYAVHHHPDRPGHHRGDALRGAHQPLAVLGSRLSPWHGRLHELPAAVIGHRNLTDALLTERTRTRAPAPAPQQRPQLGPEGHAARTEIRRILARRAARHAASRGALPR